MTQADLSATAAAIAAAGRVTADDVLALRRLCFADGAIDRAEADALFAIEHASAAKPVEWSDFFVEAIANHLLRRKEPRGYVDAADADWLVERIAANGRIGTATGLELLVALLEKAQRAPERLVRFALEAVRDTVLDGSGPARRGGAHEPGVVTEADVALLRRILYAFGGDRNAAVTRAEAEVLFDINDATAEARNHPAWSDLFVKAVASCLMLASGYDVPSRQEALRRGAWLAERGGAGSFLGRMAGDLVGLYRRPGEPRPGPAAAQGDADGRVTEAEARWLAARLDRDGRLHENEKALLDFLRANAADIHPALRPILEKAA